jgi:kynureninase
MQFENTLEFARQLDEKDPLKSFRDRFFFPQHNGKDKIYFDGNSLGLQPKSTKDYLQEVLNDWAKLGGDAHFDAKWPWYSYHENFPRTLSKIVGCLPEEVVAMNSLTLNLHLLLVSFYRPTKQRYKIICEAKAFPSDQYAFESQVKYHGLDPGNAIVEVKPRAGEYLIRTEDILSTIQQHADSTAVVLFSGLNYYTGQVFDMKKITQAGHDAGAIVGFDLAHAAGNIDLHLHDWDVDFACWCSYKYLNSGPGGVGGIYIHQKHAGNKNIPRFAGWWGYEKETRFNMEKGFKPIPTAEGWQLSNAPIVSMAVHKASLDIFEEAGMGRLHEKRKLLSDYLLFIIDYFTSQSSQKRVEVITPRNENEKGCQVSFVVNENGKKLYDYLAANGIAAGWREPEVIRVAPVPLYNSFEEVWQFGNLLKSFFEK